jgi:replicative DNA helicase
MLEFNGPRVWSVGELVADAESVRDGVTYPTGFGFLDRHLGGYVPGDTWVVAGRTSAGKSHMALAKLAGRARAGTPVVYRSLEDGARRVAARVRTGYAADKLYLTFPSPSTAALVGLMRSTAAAVGARVWCVDYIQLTRYTGGGTPWSKPDALGLTVADLKGAAAELGGVLGLVSQVTRPQPGESAQLPRLYEMKESAAVENAADVVLMVGDVNGTPTVEIAKAKDAPRGVRFSLVRDGRTGVLREPSVSDAPVPVTSAADGGDDDGW